MCWPEALEEWLRRELGEPREVKRLGGMRGAGVWLLAD
jgi:hypothetical protein